jgi:hypothetical protein
MFSRVVSVFDVVGILLNLTMFLLVFVLLWFDVAGHDFDVARVDSVCN